MALTKLYVPVNSLCRPNCLAMTLQNDWRQSKKATKPLNNSLATKGNTMRSILGPPIQPGALFYSIAAGSPPRIPPKEKHLPVQSQRQSEHEQPLQGEEICDTEVTPEAVSQFPVLSVKGDKTCPCIVAGRIQHFLGKWKQLTHDPNILNAVTGYKTDLFPYPRTVYHPKDNSFFSSGKGKCQCTNIQIPRKKGS